MPKKTSHSTDNGESNRVLLTKAINNLTSNRESFEESVKAFQTISKEMIEDLDLQIDDRTKQLDESKKTIENDLNDARIKASQQLAEHKRNIAVEFLNDLNDARIKASQQLAEHKRDIAVEFLAESGEVPIDEDELEGLREGHESVQEEHQTELDNLRDELTKKSKEELHSALNSQELRHKAAFAETQAENKMLKTEIQNLHNFIEKLKDEVDAQRKLSATIAQSNAKEAIHQTIGK